MTDVTTPVLPHARPEPATDADTLTYAQQVGARLRAARLRHGLSLTGLETASLGRWKPAVVGSYERGDRMINPAVLAELAAFYRLPVHELLPDGRPEPLPRTGRVVLNLPALSSLPADGGPLRRWVGAIQAERGDYAGRVLSIRHTDLRTLATLYNLAPRELLDLLAHWNVLDPSSSLPAPSQ
jgi:transcriptional regulator with XRE-family HTH domain